jgi:peptidoglycan glycosyltransferase
LTLGPRPIVDAAAPFQIEVARPATAAALRDTLPHSAYGQGNVLVSPLKMARVAAAIAARGVVVPVRWIRSTEATGARQERFVSESDAALLGRYMREVVTSGTGRALQSNATPIAGKTGTAEVDGRPSHSWFVGFAPYGGPARIAFAVVVENAGYGSHAAAPIAGDVVTAARELGLFK